MTRQEIFEQLKELLFLMDSGYRKLGDSLSEETALVEDLGFNSVSFLYMLIAMEETFKITFDQDVQFRTVGEVIDYLMGKL